MFGNAKVYKRCAVLAAGALVALGVTTATAGSASAAPSNGVCNGGSILGGTYLNLTINGNCDLDSGTVNVTGNVTVKAGDVLWADFGGSDLHVIGNVTVASGASLILGCGPIDFSCENDPDPMSPTLMTHHSIGGKLAAAGAADMVIHDNNIKGAVTYTNGGNGGCSFLAVPQQVSTPGFSAFEDNNVGGLVTINHISTCWMGFIRNQVKGTVTYSNVSTTLSDGNEIVSNKIGGDLKCVGNSPPPHVGDSSGGPNLVAGTRSGQCTSTSLP
jgi:hypothetical protein